VIIDRERWAADGTSSTTTLVLSDYQYDWTVRQLHWHTELVPGAERERALTMFRAKRAGIERDVLLMHTERERLRIFELPPPPGGKTAAASFEQTADGEVVVWARASQRSWTDPVTFEVGVHSWTDGPLAEWVHTISSPFMEPLPSSRINVFMKDDRITVVFQSVDSRMDVSRWSVMSACWR
jgi:hypothetical protein